MKETKRAEEGRRGEEEREGGERWRGEEGRERCERGRKEGVRGGWGRIEKWVTESM